MAQLDERLKSMTPLQRAVFALRETQARLEALERKLAEPMAIVGMACRFPGRANDPAAYWQLICRQVDAIGEVPAERWDAGAFYDPDPAAPGKTTSRWGGFLERIDEFDNHFFGISDREAARMDPQHRLLLELAWEALEDAGLPPEKLRGSKMGVYLGISVSEYGLMQANDLAQTDAHAATGTSLSLAANRLSYAFGWHGPSVSIDTACSSSLVALHLACQSIRNGECDSALVGGVSLLLSPIASINLTKAGFCAPDGRVRAFDAAASGYVRSEGAGLIVIKPLAAALKDKDLIYATVRGSAVNQNGVSNGLTAPSRAAQEQVLREAYARAKVSPGEVQFVETQGTGTPLGDTIEALALAGVLGDGRSPDHPCAIGAVKTNIGHLEAASGIAGLMKVALALKYRQLPPNLHFHTPNPNIPFASLPLRVQRVLEPWPENGAQIAGVSAFGFGGSNSHVVLEGPPAENDGQTDSNTDDSTAASPSQVSLPLLLSARTDSALRDLAARYVAYLRSEPPTWRDVCYTAAACRDHHDCRLAVTAESCEQAITMLECFVRGELQPGVVAGRRPPGRVPKIAFFGHQPEKCDPDIAKLYTAGADFLWEQLALGGRRVHLPTYPWQRQRLWAVPNNRWAQSPAGAGDPAEAAHSPLSVAKPAILEEISLRPDLTVPYIEPRTQLERDMAESWSAILRIKGIGIYDNFFELGGDSLQATILLNRLQEHLAESVTGHVLFQVQTIGDLADYLRQHYPVAVRQRYGAEEFSADGKPANAELGLDIPKNLTASNDVSITRLARDDRAEELLGRLDELSDAEVEALLAKETAISGEMS